MATRSRESNGGTASRILDSAEHLVQSRGYNAFSYADVAAELHITKAALHYHFAGKAELGEALLRRYAERFAEALDAIDAEPATGPAQACRLRRPVSRRFATSADVPLRDARRRVPDPARVDAGTLWSSSSTTKRPGWRAILEQGRQEGTLSFEGSTSEAARFVVAALEGAMLVALPFGDVARFQEATKSLIAGLRSEAPAGR